MTYLDTVQRECDRIAAKCRVANDEMATLPEGEARNAWAARRDALAEGLLCLCRVKRALMTES